MKNAAHMQRPLSRIDSVLSKLRHVCHYYPGHSLLELIQEAIDAANQGKPDSVPIAVYDIEDISYDAGHLFHNPINLESGIEALCDRHRDQSLPPTPIQTALIGRVAAAWRSQSQMRLGQLLSNAQMRLPAPDELCLDSFGG